MNGLTEEEARALRTPVPQCDHYSFCATFCVNRNCIASFCSSWRLKKEKRSRGPFLRCGGRELANSERHDSALARALGQAEGLGWR